MNNKFKTFEEAYAETMENIQEENPHKDIASRIVEDIFEYLEGKYRLDCIPFNKLPEDTKCLFRWEITRIINKHLGGGE